MFLLIVIAAPLKQTDLGIVDTDFGSTTRHQRALSIWREDTVVATSGGKKSTSKVLQRMVEHECVQLLLHPVVSTRA